MKILIATDGSASSEAAVREVAGEVWPRGAQVRLLYALELLPRHTYAAALMPPEAYAELERLERSWARRFLDEGALILSASGFREEDVETSVVVGSPKRVIVDEATAWGADLVVLGSHGDGPWKRLLLGSVSNAVALHLPCSVRVVRPRRKAA